MVKHAFIVAGSQNYMPGLRALIHSLHINGNGEDLIIISHNLDFGSLDFSKLKYNVYVVDSLIGDQIKGTAFERFAFAISYSKQYDAICLLDADMFITGDVSTFFDVAARGFIVTGSNGMIINFGLNYQQYYKLDLGKPDIPYAKVHTTVPIFINEYNIDWFETWYNAPRIDSFDDFLFLNMVGIKLGKDKRMICMPPYMFTGIHHWMLKPETSVRIMGGLLLSGTEEQVYMVHGKWWDEGWLSDLPRVMYKYLDDNQFGAKNIQRVDDATRLLLGEFKKYSEMELKP
jgi:hypothetical protein